MSRGMCHQSCAKKASACTRLDSPCPQAWGSRSPRSFSPAGAGLLLRHEILRTVPSAPSLPADQIVFLLRSGSFDKWQPHICSAVKELSTPFNTYAPKAEVEFMHLDLSSLRCPTAPRSFPFAFSVQLSLTCFAEYARNLLPVSCSWLGCLVAPPSPSLENIRSHGWLSHFL